MQQNVFVGLLSKYFLEAKIGKRVDVFCETIHIDKFNAPELERGIPKAKCLFPWAKDMFDGKSECKIASIGSWRQIQKVVGLNLHHIPLLTSPAIALTVDQLTIEVLLVVLRQKAHHPLGGFTPGGTFHPIDPLMIVALPVLEVLI